MILSLGILGSCCGRWLGIRGLLRHVSASSVLNCILNGS
jgi:hypothetical protein